MMQMQLRTPENTKIQDVVSELALAILESLKRELDSSDVPFESYRALEEPLIVALYPWLEAYDSCGMDAICTEGINAPQPDVNDRIYFLQLPEDLDLVDRISDEALESIRPILDVESAASLSRRVRFSIQRILSSHLYRNPFCRRHEACKDSQRINPWSTSVL